MTDEARKALADEHIREFCDKATWVFHPVNADQIIGGIAPITYGDLLALRSQPVTLAREEAAIWLKRYEPSETNTICKCSGNVECVYHSASRIIRSLTPSHEAGTLEPFIEYRAKLRERFPESTSDTIIVGGPYNLTYKHFDDLIAALSPVRADKQLKD